MKNTTRKDFIINSTKVLGMTAGAMALGTGLVSPKNVLAAKIEFPESSCGTEKKGGKKILVAYDSFCGTTGKVAETIGNVLCNSSAKVDVRLIKNIKNLESYDAVVVGSAVHASSWRFDAIDFVKENQKYLSQVPVAYFLTCLALYFKDEKSRKVAESYMEPTLKAVPQIKPKSIGLFAGVLDYSKLNFMYRTVMKIKMSGSGIPEGDFRDWKAIQSWAKGLAPMFYVKQSA